MAGALTAAIAAAFSGGAAVVTDDYFEYTTLLLPGNGTNGAQNNTFLDGSANNFTITRNGNTTQGTFSPFSQTGWGNYFDGSGDSLSVASNTALQLTGAFTMEAWYYPLGFAGSGLYDCLLTTGDNSLSNAIAIYISSSGGIQLYNHVTNAAIFNTASGVVLNAWNHIAATRNSSNGVDLWLNGVSQGSTVTVSSSFTSTTPTRIGTSSTNQDCYGYISNARIVKGVAVYTGAFTSPTSPLTATQSAGTNIAAITGTQTSLLTCQSNRFIDNSTNNFTITRNGDTSVVAFSPFNPTASWSAATYGGSGYFDGNVDYLQVATNAAFDMSTGDYTFEAWVYLTSLASLNRLFSSSNSGFSSGYFISISTSGFVVVETNSPSYQSLASTNNAITANNWTHVALTKSSGTVRVFVNGSLCTTSGSQTNSFSTGGNALQVGGSIYTAGYGYLNGYISNARIVKGQALYTSAFTPSTTPLTTTSQGATAGNVSLLLNFTNAGIYDATSKNDLETVGNAQISTAISAKWGSGTIALDGNGDYLTIPSSQLNVFGTGDFTIEMWAYITDYTTGSPTFNDYGPFFDFRTANTSQVNVVLSFLSTFGGTGRPCMFINGSVTITGNVITTNSWTHIALSRVSGVTRMYMGGDQAGSNYTDTNNYTSTVCTIGVNIARDAYLKGYIQDPRITRGYGRYVTGTGGNAGKMVLNGTNTLALPTAAFPTL